MRAKSHGERGHHALTVGLLGLSTVMYGPEAQLSAVSSVQYLDCNQLNGDACI